MSIACCDGSCSKGVVSDKINGLDILQCGVYKGETRKGTRGGIAV